MERFYPNQATFALLRQRLSADRRLVLMPNPKIQTEQL